MKKRIVVSLSIVITASSLLMTACGDKNDTVSAVNNNVSIETESSTEPMSSTEIETQTETETQDNTESSIKTEITSDNESESDENISVDSTSTTGHFTEGEERGEDADNFETSETPTQQETTPENKVRDAGFTVDDFTYDPSKTSAFDNVDEMKEYLQFWIDDYASGGCDYYELMGALADVGIDSKVRDAFIKEYEKTPFHIIFLINNQQ